MTAPNHGTVSAFFRDTCLTRLARLILGWPWTLLIIASLLTVGSCWLIFTRLETKTAHSDLIASDDPSATSLKEYSEDFGTPFVMIAVLECDPSLAPVRRQLAAELQRQLKAQPTLVKEADFQLDLSTLKGRELYALTTNDLLEIQATLKSEGPWLRKLSEIPSLEGFFKMADTRFGAEQSGGKLSSTSDAVEGLKMFAGLFQKMNEAASNPQWQQPEGSFWEEMFSPRSTANFNNEMREGYFVSYDDKLMFMFIQPANPSRDVKPLRAIVDTTRDLFLQIQKSNPAYANIKLGLSGEPKSAVEEADSTGRDMQLFGSLSIVGVSILLMFGFRGFKFPIILVVALGFGIAWTFGLTTLLIGHVNLLTQVVPIILVGLGMDFGIHLLARYREQLRRGSMPTQALREAIVENGASIVMSAVTTAVAFFSIAIKNFKGFAEMGIVAGLGVLCCLLAMITVVPALVALRRQDDEIDEPKLHPAGVPVGVDPDEPQHPPFVEQIFQYPWWILAVGVVVTAVMIFYWQRVTFDYRIANLSVAGAESVVYETRMMKESDYTMDCVSLICKDLAQAEAISDQALKLPSVKKVESLSSRFLGGTAAKQSIMTTILPNLAGVFETAPEFKPTDPAALATAVNKLIDRLDRLQELAFDGGQKELAKVIGQALKNAQAFNKTLKSNQPGLADRTSKFERYFIGDLASQIARFRTCLKADPITLDTIPKDIRDNFVGKKNGKVQVMVYPKCDHADRPGMDLFMKDVGSLGVTVAGTLREFYDMTGLMREGFNKAALYAVVAVYLLLLIDFRRFKAATLTLVPDLLGTVWMAGLMGFTGIDFNPANLMVLPLIIGIGLANGVHVMHRFREHRDADIAHVVWHTGLAVMLGSLVTIVGFGCLGLAQNLGIASIGKALTLGVGARIFTSIIILPAMLVIVQRQKWKI